MTIGNFDGLHEGHRRIMRRVVEIARAHGWTPTVLTFDPHPTRVVAPERAPRLMTTMGQRVALMRAEGIERVEVLPFDRAVAELTPEQFVRTILCERLKAKAILVGANFRFGAKQAGNVDTLRALGDRLGFTTEILPEVKLRGRTVSSSAIRQLIGEGRAGMAGRMLGRPFALEGEVVPGHGVGGKQTVPTLNLSSVCETLPRTGVYVTRTCDLDDGREWESITNVGYRPTFGGEDQPTIETFLLSPFDGNTPARIRVEFLRRVREERKFDSPDALKTQIFKDVRRAQSFFRRFRKWRSSTNELVA